jgi:hypothetical protein
MMIKVGLMGGVGNMLFQLARGASLAEFGHEVSFFHVVPRSRLIYRGLGWTFQPHWLDMRALAACLGMVISTNSPLDHLRMGSIFLGRRARCSEYAFDRSLDRVLARPSPLDVGYFQSPKHVNNTGLSRVLDALVEHCGPISRRPVVTLHLRGADLPNHERMTIDDIAAVLKVIPVELPVRVVSNDQAYVAKLAAANLRPLELLNGTPFSDFCSLAASEHLILSNSTFGFWAAALANASEHCSIHVQPGSLFTRFPELFPDMMDVGSAIGQVKSGAALHGA